MPVADIIGQRQPRAMKDDCVAQQSEITALPFWKVGYSLADTARIYRLTGSEEAMFTKKPRYRLPNSVDEAAELLISDMLIQHLQALSQMTDGDFELLCEKVTPFLIEEFRLWQGNDELLGSCCEQIDGDVHDPARIILNRVKQKLQNFHGIVIIT